MTSRPPPAKAADGGARDDQQKASVQTHIAPAVPQQHLPAQTNQFAAIDTSLLMTPSAAAAVAALTASAAQHMQSGMPQPAARTSQPSLGTLSRVSTTASSSTTASTANSSVPTLVFGTHPTAVQQPAAPQLAVATHHSSSSSPVTLPAAYPVMQNAQANLLVAANAMAQAQAASSSMQNWPLMRRSTRSSKS